jgi:hypothetical protein
MVKKSWIRQDARGAYSPVVRLFTPLTGWPPVRGCAGCCVGCCAGF